MNWLRVIGVAGAAGLIGGCGAEAAGGSADPPDAAADNPLAVATDVRVVDNGQPVPAAKVVFHAPDGTVIELVETDANGWARGPVSPGGLVTIAQPGSIGPADARIQLLTYSGPEPGRPIAIEIPDFPRQYQPDLGPIVGWLQLALPPGGDVIRWDMGCTSGLTGERQPVLEVRAACLGSDRQVAVRADAYLGETPPSAHGPAGVETPATAGDSPLLVGSGFVSGIEIPDNAIATASIDSWTVPPLPTLQVQVSDVPEAVTDALAIAAPRVDDVPYSAAPAGTAATGGANHVTLTPALLSGFGDSMDLTLDLRADAETVTRQIAFRVPVEATALSATELLPLVSAPHYDSETGQLSWAQSGTGRADARLLGLSSIESPEVGGRQRRWLVLRDPEVDATAFGLPPLPDELAQHRPGANGETAYAGVTLLEVDWVGDYQSFLRDHGTRFLDDACVPAPTSYARVSYSGPFYGPVFRDPPPGSSGP